MIKLFNPLRRVKKLRTQFLIVLIIAGILSVQAWHLIWEQQPRAWRVLKNIPGMVPDQDAFIEDLRQKAKNYYIPDSEDDTEAVEQIQSFFDSADKYTSINIYGRDDSYYRVGHVADLMYTPTWNIFSSMVFQITYIEPANSQQSYDLSENLHTIMEFANGEADVYITFFHNSRITIPYFIFSLSTAIFLFLFITLMFIRKKISHVLNLKDNILLMSGGDLSHPIPNYGADEIGILSQELDKLRLALDENMQQEAASRRANQDLITAMSHDLRTPLTILNGYLEVLKLKKMPDMQEEYLNRCLEKTDDIRQMTDRMFEYALVFEDTETVTLTKLPISWIHQCLAEHIDFLRLAGFTVKESLCESSGTFPGDETILKRVFQNLFSNILKYGDKKDAVQIQCLTEHSQIKITLTNSVKQNLSGIESNHIGLKSVEKMIALHNGSLFISREGELYIVEITLPGYSFETRS